MSKRPITKAEADILIQTDKYIDTKITWIEDVNRENTFDFRIALRVVGYPGVKLIMRGNTNIVLRRHTFAIIYNGSARIKALDIGKIHPNKCSNHQKETIGTKHKHTWQDCCGDKWAYEPDDITDHAPLEQVFWEFLKECNIHYPFEFPAIPTQQLELVIDELFDN